MLRIKINGNNEDIKDETTALELLEIKNIDKNSIVFIVNDKILKKDDLGKYILKQNDDIEILRFVSGG